MSDQQIEKKISTSDIKGWVRTGLTIISVIGSMYYFKGQVDSHIDNKEIHRSPTELNDIYVLRREYDANVTGIKDDLRYLRNRMDVLIDVVNKVEKK